MIPESAAVEVDHYVQGAKGCTTGEGRAAVNDSYRWLVLIVAGTSAFMGALDGSIINIIIPQIQAQYQATLGDISGSPPPTW